ncbi:MAG TPA: hypothetical protein VLS27_02990 [Gammaproteobacteria bacterium]|nr:hypothetical protein [Gammaproteobacteria bacterium]
MTIDGSHSLLTVRVRPVVAVSVLIVGLGLMLVALDGLFFKLVFPDPLHVVFKVVLWILFVASAVTTFVGIKQLVRPARIFAVTEDGIVQYMRAGIALERGQLIPWDRMESMELTEASGYHGRRSRIIVVAVKVRSDENWPKERLYNFDEASGRVMLDAFSGKPAGKPLLERLVSLRASHQAPARAEAAD